MPNEAEAPPQPLRLRQIGPETYTTYLGDIEYVPTSALAPVADLFALMTKDHHGDWCFNSLSGDWRAVQCVMKALEAARDVALSATVAPATKGGEVQDGLD